MDNKQVIEVIDNIIDDVKPYLLKFKEGTSQHSLVRNRINALEVSKHLILNDKVYTKEEVQLAIKPIESIISKTLKVLLKLKENTYQYNRSKDIVDAMQVALIALKEY